MAISKEEIEKIARLSRLNITSEEQEKYSTQLSAILDYVEQLKELPNTEAELENFRTLEELRADENDSGRFQEKIIENAPESKNNYFVVPAVFESGEENV